MAEMEFLSGLASPPRWMDQALCAESDPDAWWPEGGCGLARRWAIRICGNCPVQAQCLRFALDHDEPAGIWGGTTREQRRAMRRAGRAAS